MAQRSNAQEPTPLKRTDTNGYASTYLPLLLVPALMSVPPAVAAYYDEGHSLTHALTTFTAFALFWCFFFGLFFGLVFYTGALWESARKGVPRLVRSQLPRQVLLACAIAAVATPLARWSRGFVRLNSWYDYGVTLATAFLVLDLTFRFSGRPSARNLLLAFAAAYLVVALLHHSISVPSF